MSSDLRSLADEYHQYDMEQNPTTAHMYGDYRYADRMEDASRSAEDENITRLREFGARARAIDPFMLSPEDALTREVLIFEVESKADLDETRQAEFAVDPIFGLHIYAQLMPPMLSVPDADVAAAMVEKWKSYAGTIDQMTERFREGVAAGRTPAEFAVEAVIGQLDDWLALPIEQDPLLMTQEPPDFSDEQRLEWKEALGTAVRESVRPAVERQRDVLRDDPELHHTSGANIVKASEDAFARAREKMPDWFGKLPKADCIVEETQSGAQAFYFPAADDGSRPGMFFMNTADPSSWGIHQVESTAFHEGIPGHHLQNSIAQELGDAVPDFRRHLHIVAYGEGWALYSERISDEMGIYGSQLDRMGMLVADSMRAGRLVVDTGMHALGWSRQQAINYLAENTPMSLYTITEEIDRYIASMPGQALSYMIGRIEIERIRQEAEHAMGDRFDVKAFHDTVLGSGAVPLETLDRIVSEWAASA